MFRYFYILLLATVMTACFDAKFIADGMSNLGTMDDMKLAFYKERSPEQAFLAVPGMIAMLDGFIASSPENAVLLAKGAEMNCSQALLLLESEHPEWAILQYSKGLRLGLRSLAVTNPSLARALKDGDEKLVGELAKGVEMEQLEPLLWTGICWGGLANLDKSAENISAAGLIEALVTRSIELNDKIFFGAGYLLLGMRHSVIPPSLGCHTEAGRKFF